MKLKETVKKIFYSLYNSGRVILLDYKITPKRNYEEQTGKPHKALYEIIDENRKEYQQLLEGALDYKSVFEAIRYNKDVTNSVEPGWNNNHFPGLDIIMLYSLVARLKPAKYIEIGSGTSTRVAYKSRKDNSLTMEIISIDPSPRNEISGIADKHYKKTVQDTDLEVFSSLMENDIVFFDGTHTLLPNSDVMWFFLEIFPKLPKGVIVHIHDVYLPYDYPDFMCARYYNEQYLLGAILLSNSEKFKIICPNYFICTDSRLSSIIKPVFELTALRNVERHGGSFWIQIKN